MHSDLESRAIASGDGVAANALSDVAPWARDRQRTNSSWALMPIVAASGFAGLGYEIVWTRQLSLALGTEMMAVLGAVAGLFAGLALGAFALDRPIRRARSPRTVYAALEVVIGLWGLINIWLLPVAGRVLSPVCTENSIRCRRSKRTA
jgi:spermidine synthase